MESNDSPEIPDRGGGGDIRHPRPPFGGIRARKIKNVLKNRVND